MIETKEFPDRAVAVSTKIQSEQTEPLLAPSGRKKTQFGKKNRSKLIFYICGLALPLLQFAVFYIGVNINSVLLAFQKYDIREGYSFAGFENFAKVFRDFAELEYLGNSILNSLILFAFTLLGMFAALLFSFYISKRHFGSKLFRTVLFLPNIISNIVLVLMFKYFAENFIPTILELITGNHHSGLLSSSSSDLTFWTVLFFTIWSGFGTQVLLFGGAMNGISQSVIEAAKLDGITPLKEFFYITLPMIMGTITTFVIVAVTAIFTNQMNLFSFFSKYADVQTYTLGYYFYRAVQTAGMTDFPPLAALSVLMTIICVPITITVRFFLNKAEKRFA